VGSDRREGERHDLKPSLSALGYAHDRAVSVAGLQALAWALLVPCPASDDLEADADGAKCRRLVLPRLWAILDAQARLHLRYNWLRVL
jgi:hypothetical protein